MLKLQGEFKRGYAVCLGGLLALALLAAAGCKPGAENGRVLGGGPLSKDDATLVATPLAPASPVSGKFTELAAADTGLDFNNMITDEAVLNEEQFTQSGVASGDIDNDGDLDVLLVGIVQPNKLYRNDGGFRFTDITGQAGAPIDGAGQVKCAAYFGDYDNDGNLDLFMCNRSVPNQLFRGDGKGGFKEAPDDGGLSDSESSTACAGVFDADNDGDLDIFAGGARPYKFGEELRSAPAAVQAVAKKMQMISRKDRPTKAEMEAFLRDNLPPEYQNLYYVDPSGLPRAKPAASELYINNGDGSFSENTKAAGLSFISWTNGVQAADYNDDGWTDLYIASDYETPDRMFLNNRDGTFKDVSNEMLRKSPLYSMGVDSGDVNGDGQIDLMTADMLSPDYKRAKKQSGDMWSWRWELINSKPQPQMRNMLFVNRGGGYMSEVGKMCSVDATDWTWSVRFADLNCDGLPEIYCSNGFVRDAADVDSNKILQSQARDNPPPSPEMMRKLRANAPSYYTDDVIFTSESPLKLKKPDDNWGLHDGAMSCGASLADYDGDGDQDLVLAYCNSPKAGVWRNDVATGNRVSIDLRQPGKNHFAIGARVRAYCGDQQYVRDALIARGYETSESGRIYLGLGAADQIDRLEVRWPDLTTQAYAGLPAGMHYVITKAAHAAKWAVPAAPQPLFAQADLPFRQVERDTTALEFAKQDLLPFQQSTQGTGEAAADFDGDGALDLYLCGAAGQPGALLKGDGAGGFAPLSLPGLDPAAALPEAAEEMSALAADFDGDARPDLLITSGGMESPAGSPVYQSRLLLNTAAGWVDDPLPPRAVSTGSACSADIDGDGDLDLLLCGQLVPDAYAAVAPSALYLNDGAGKFTDATDKLAPWLKTTGPINEAQFCDFSGDGLPELVCALDWGPVTLYANSGGVLTQSAELTDRGWWHSLAVGDFNADGVLDILAGNTGEDTKYHPKDGAPVTMYAYDFDGNGRRDLVEVKYSKDGTALPGRGRSCSGYAIGYIPKKFPTWASFADAKLADVYGPGLAQAARYDVKQVDSVLLKGLGGGKFAPSAKLPGVAQWAPAYGIATGDFNGDGILDAYLSNNFTLTQPETGHWDTGYGTVVLGGRDALSALEPGQSGIRVWQDGRGAVGADFNADGRADLALSVSNAAPQLCLAASAPDQALHAQGGRGLAVTLQGAGKNTAGVGALLTLTLADGSTQLRVVQAGQGYLSSYAGAQLFWLPAGASPSKLTVQWPGGKSTDTTDLSSDKVTVKQE